METLIVPNGIVTVESPKGGHRTFKIHTAKRGKLEGKRIVSLLTGPENTSDYTGFAFVDHLNIWVWQKCHNHLRPTDFDKYGQVLWSMYKDGAESPYYQMGYRLRESRHCLRCNRLLTTPESIERGIGPECAQMH